MHANLCSRLPCPLALSAGIGERLIRAIRCATLDATQPLYLSRLFHLPLYDLLSINESLSEAHRVTTAWLNEFCLINASPTPNS